VGAHLKKFWATHVTWIAALIGFLDPSVKAWLDVPGHVKYAFLVGGAWAILLHNMTAPKNAEIVAEAKAAPILPS
jgi:hypothetical protein